MLSRRDMARRGVALTIGRESMAPRRFRIVNLRHHRASRSSDELRFPIVDFMRTSGPGPQIPPPRPFQFAGGRLYVSYGGRYGDCGDYHGVVIEVDPAKRKITGDWATRATGGGIWGRSGVAFDGTSLYVADFGRGF